MSIRPIQILYNTIICVLPSKDMNLFLSITALAVSLSLDCYSSEHLLVF
jgi:hypothetical protein